jgi:hypothetical protein
MPTDADRQQVNTICNTNDDPRCPAGFFRGEDCTTPVPPTERQEAKITVVLCTDQTCDAISEQEIRLTCARATSVGAEYFTVKLVSKEQRDGTCCLTFEITVAKEAADGSIDVDQVASATAERLSQLGFTVETSSAMKLGVSVVLATALALFAL